MPHGAPVVGAPHTVGRQIFLDRQGSYIPTLLAASTDPNLGESGQAVGGWHLRGHLCTGWFRFFFSGAEVDRGTGAYDVVLPFPADLSIMNVNTNNNGDHFIIGSGRARASVQADSRIVATLLGRVNHLRMVENARNAIVTGQDATWTRIAGNFRYLVDPNALGQVR